MTGDPDKEYRTNKPPPTRRVRKGGKETLRVHPLPRIPLAAFILAEQCMRHQERPWIRMMAKDHLETNPITIKPETVSHATEQFYWVPLPYSSPPRCPFPIKSLALSAHVSPQTIHVRVLDKSPVSGPGRGPLSCNRRKEEGKKRDKKNEGERKRLVLLLLWLLSRKFCPHEIETCQIVLLIFWRVSLMHGSKVISTVVLGSLAENRKDYCLHCHV